MTTHDGARFWILGRASGSDLILLVMDDAGEATARAKEVAALPCQSPVAVIDTRNGGGVAFYFADGGVCLVLRNSRDHDGKAALKEASHAIDNGAPITLVSATLGHADLKTTSVYAHARPGESSGRYLKFK